MTLTSLVLTLALEAAAALVSGVVSAARSPAPNSSAFSLLWFRELWLAEDGERLRLLALFLLDSAATVGTGEKPTRLMIDIFNVFCGKSSATL